MPLSKNRKGTGPRDESPEAGPSRRAKYSSDEDDEPAQRKGDKHQSSKMSKQCGTMSKKSPGISKQVGGHGTHNKPAELFRKDLISAMKLADTEILYEDEYLVISDPWRQEWEKGVQVPVNEEEIPNISIINIKNSDKAGDFKIPIRKYMHEKNDETYQVLYHELTGMQELAEQIVRYDLDDQDVTWLELINEDREEMGLQVINEWNLERMIEELENQCYVKTNALKKTEEGLGIEYDEDIACDVCRMLESEDTNEMVFCDGCDICVHQACYGIQTIPEGSWLCRICALRLKPMCLLCPKRGGAMKSTRSGTKWTHVSCALWIPEVSIGCPEKMEPITKISNIPASRWALVCCLCKERVGACIQCSVKQCKTAFHVTCGFSHNLDMKTILDDTDELDGIHLRAFCPKHTKNRNASDSDSPKKEGEEDEEVDAENDVNEAEMAKQRAEKLNQLDEEFYTLVDIQDIALKFYIPEEAVDVVAEYWKLKRKVNNNKPLITPKMEEEDQMQKQQKDSLSARMKMFVHLRQDLERARNLCYMIGKREKTKKQFFNLNENVFRSQISALTDPDSNWSAREADKIRQEYKFDSLYCSLSSTWSKSSHSKAPRKNLFTLENLKTPKDYSEDDSASKVKMEKDLKFKQKSKKVQKLPLAVPVKKDPSVDSVSVTTDDSVSVKTPRENLFSSESFKMVGDTTADSSEDEVVSWEDGVNAKTDSTQMSRLGKVKAEEIVANNSEEKVEEKTSTATDTKSKKNAGSDLKMKLTTILQSKNLMQKQDKLSEESCSQELSVIVDNSDNEVFTDSNTDFVSPVEQPRNLFDQFEMSKGFSGAPDLSSPDMPRSSKSSSKRRKRKKEHNSHKHKRHIFSDSPSDQSSISSNSLKHDPILSTDADSRPVLAECPSLLSEDTEREKSTIASPVTAAEISESAINRPKLPKHSDTDERHHSSSKHHRSRKRTHADRGDDGLSPEDVKPIRSSSAHKTPKMSPSPRVDPVNVYGTVDGDIYVPSGKIQVTERTIVLDSPKEEKTRVHGKLRLKKQANSPIKGVVSYEVVNNDYSDNVAANVEHIKQDDAPLDKPDDYSNDKHVRHGERESVIKTIREDNPSRDRDGLDDYEKRSKDNKNIKRDPLLQDKQEKISSSRFSSHQKLREKNRRSETKHGKLLSDSLGNVAKVIDDSGIDNSRKKKNCVDEITELSPVTKGKLSRRSLRNVTPQSHEPGYSSDENFVPATEKPKSPASEKSQRSHRQRASRNLFDTDGESGDTDSVRSLSPQQKRSQRHKSSPAIQLNLFQNRPELNALLDSRKLVVKNSVKKHVGDRLSHMLKNQGRWGRRYGTNQLTLDGFMKPVNANDDVFAKVGLKADREALDSFDSSNDLTSFSEHAKNDSSVRLSGKGTDSLVSSSISLNIPANGNVFGTHECSHNGKDRHKTSVGKWSDSSSGKTRSSANVDGKGDSTFGEMPSASPQASFREVSRSSRDEERAPSTHGHSVFDNENLDTVRNYRSHSPLSSEGSEVSSRNPVMESREEGTPRRTTRHRSSENSQSPITPGRLRNREGLIKPSPLKNS